MCAKKIYTDDLLQCNLHHGRMNYKFIRRHRESFLTFPMSIISVDRKMSNVSGAMGTEFPAFLTSGYFEVILQKYNKDPNLKVHWIKIGPCGAPGDAFASSMFRVEVGASQNGKSDLKGNYIVKMMPTLQLARDKLGIGGYDVQEKEMEIFQNVFPAFRKILKPIGGDKNLFPKAIAVDRLRQVLVLEDLALKRFVMADRKVGLDEQHVKMSLVKLANFHAASMVLLASDPEIFKKFEVGMFSRKTSAFHDFFGSNMDALINEVSSWDGYEAYAAKLKNLRPKLFENSFKVFDNEPGDMKVLIHGDLWLNNLMFNYDMRGSLHDAIIVSLNSFHYSIFNANHIHMHSSTFNSAASLIQPPIYYIFCTHLRLVIFAMRKYWK